MENVNPKILSMYGQGGSLFGVALMKWAEVDERIVVITADQANPAGLDKFKSTYPNRFIDVGIAEQNMIGIAAGLADEGYIPICVAQACFLTMRAFEPIRQYAGYMHKKIIFVGLLSGFSTTFFGNTHYAIEDVALMRTIPNMNICAPCDAISAIQCVEASIDSTNPSYIRLWGGNNIPIVYSQPFDFKIEKSIRLREGKDIQMISTGSMVRVALNIADRLLENGIDAEVVDMTTIKPLDIDAISKVKPIYTIEEHSVIGGLGDAVASAGYKVFKIGVEDRYSQVGDYDFLLLQNGLEVEQIVEKIIRNK